LKHYAQTIEYHFNRRSGGVESGTAGVQKTTRCQIAGNCRERKRSPKNDDGEAVFASPWNSSQDTAQLFCGAEEIRTLDLCSAIAALYQLSYRPKRVCIIESLRLMTRDHCQAITEKGSDFKAI
jgi:hypothetical protein